MPDLLVATFAAGLGFGLADQEFVAENIDDWAASFNATMAGGDEDSEGKFQFE